MNTMHLQFLAFDCSEDAEGVAYWDAWAQQVLSSALHDHEAVTFSLSISGTPAFSAAFRENWNSP